MESIKHNAFLLKKGRQAEVLGNCRSIKLHFSSWKNLKEIIAQCASSWDITQRRVTAKVALLRTNGIKPVTFPSATAVREIISVSVLHLVGWLLTLSHTTISEAIGT